jgi:hypothetical protein
VVPLLVALAVTTPATAHAREPVEERVPGEAPLAVTAPATAHALYPAEEREDVVTERVPGAAPPAITAPATAHVTDPAEAREDVVTERPPQDAPPAVTAPLPAAAEAPPPQEYGRQSAARTFAKGAGALLLVEGLLAGYSALAAFHPGPVGVVQVITAPLSCNGTPGPNAGRTCLVLGVELVALGLYNAIELRGEGYSRSDRFWRNFLAFHVMFASIPIIDLVLGRGGPEEARSRSAPGVGIALAHDGAPILVLSGRL